MDRISRNQITKLDKIYHELIFTNQKNSPIFNDKLKDITTIEISILELIDKNPDIILRQIREKLNIPNSTLTNAINRLEKRDLVKRTISSKDRRSFGLLLTDKGKLAQDEHKKDEEKLWNIILNSLTTDEREIFLTCFDKIVKRLQNISEE